MAAFQFGGVRPAVPRDTSPLGAGCEGLMSQVVTQLDFPTTTRAAQAGAPAPGFAKAWVHPPEDDRHQLTHAVDAGLRIALCGVSTTARRGGWPPDATLWDSPLGRCPVCARVVYGSPDRRH